MYNPASDAEKQEIVEMAAALNKQTHNRHVFPKGNDYGTQFKPGEMANPNGRPRKEICITSIQKELLDQPCPYDAHDPPWTWAEVLAEAELRQAIKLPQAMHNLRGRLEGPVTNPIDLTSGGQPLKTFILRESSGEPRTADELAGADANG